MHKSSKKHGSIDKQQINFITLLTLVIFCLYIFINVLFPYAGIVSVCFLALGVGIMLYCLFDQNETLLLFSLISAIISIIFALVKHPFFMK